MAYLTEFMKKKVQGEKIEESDVVGMRRRFIIVIQNCGLDGNDSTSPYCLLEVRTGLCLYLKKKGIAPH